MAITSRIEKEHGTDTGKGNGYGYQKKALADGSYTMDVSGISAINHGSVDQTSAFTKLADGTPMNTEVRAGSITIDSALGDAALHLQTDSNNGRLRVNDAFDAAHQTTLGDLGHLNFDFYVQSSDRTDVTPVIRLAVDADGDLSTTADRGELVFEWAYQGFGAVPTGQWVHADLTGGDWNAWQRSNGANRDFYPNIVAFSDWADSDGFTPTGGLHFDEHSVVLGWSIAYGSGNGTGSLYLDHLQVGAETINFA
jgi:hypothetical protein